MTLLGMRRRYFHLNAACWDIEPNGTRRESHSLAAALEQLSVQLTALNGYSYHDLTRYCLIVDYWPKAITTSALDEYVQAQLYRIATEVVDAFPDLTDGTSLVIEPSHNPEPLPADDLPSIEAPLFYPERFQPAATRAYTLNGFIVHLDDNGQLDERAFAELTKPLKELLMPLRAIVRADITRGQILVRYVKSFPVELLDGYVNSAIRQFYASTADNQEIFPQLKRESTDLRVIVPA